MSGVNEGDSKRRMDDDKCADGQIVILTEAFGKSLLPVVAQC